MIWGIVITALVVAGAVLLAYAWRMWLQLCPHCAWVVRRVDHGWRRCARCRKQYGRHARLR